MTESMRRPQFIGERKPSEVDKNVMEIQYPRWKKNVRRFLSNSCTFVFCTIVVVCVYIWTVIFEGSMGILSSLCLVAQIKLFDLIWSILTPILTNFENHER